MIKTEKLKALFALLTNPQSARTSGLRIYLNNSPGFGQLAISKHIHDQIRDLGYEGTIEIIYETEALYRPEEYGGPEKLNTLEKTENMFNINLEMDKIIEHPDYATKFISVEYFINFQQEFEQMHLGLTDDEAGQIYEEGGDKAALLRVDYLALFDSQSEPDSIVRVIKHGDIAQDYKLTKDNCKIVYPLADFSAAEKYAQSPRLQKQKPSLATLLKLVNEEKILIHTIYGLDEVFKFPTETIIQRLVKVHQKMQLKNGGSKPVVILLMNEFQKLELAYLRTMVPDTVKIGSIKSNLGEMLQQLTDDSITVIEIGSVPMPIFEYLYAISHFTPVSEGDNAEILGLMTGKPKLDTRKLSKEIEAKVVKLDKESGNDSFKFSDIMEKINLIAEAFCSSYNREAEESKIEKIVDYLLKTQEIDSDFYKFWDSQTRLYHYAETDRLTFILETIQTKLVQDPLPTLRNPHIETELMMALLEARFEDARKMLSISNPFVCSWDNNFSAVALIYHNFWNAYHKKLPTLQAYGSLLRTAGKLYPNGTSLVSRYLHEGREPLILTDYRKPKYLHDFIKILNELENIQVVDLSNLGDDELNVMFNLAKVLKESSADYIDEQLKIRTRQAQQRIMEESSFQKTCPRPGLEAAFFSLAGDTASASFFARPKIAIAKGALTLTAGALASIGSNSAKLFVDSHEVPQDNNQFTSPSNALTLALAVPSLCIALILLWSLYQYAECSENKKSAFRR